MTNDEFLGMAIRKMVEKNVNIHFSKRIYDSKDCAPYFCHVPKPTFALNYFQGNFKEWFPIFIHEYCHFIQWQTQFKKWEPYDKDLVEFNQYLDGISDIITPNSIKRVQELELDCDKKALRLIKKFNLDVDFNKWIKESNTYILCHPLFIKYKRFFTPFNKEVFACVPSKHITKKILDDTLNPILDAVYLKYLQNYLKK